MELQAELQVTVALPPDPTVVVVVQAGNQMGLQMPVHRATMEGNHLQVVSPEGKGFTHTDTTVDLAEVPVLHMAVAAVAATPVAVAVAANMEQVVAADRTMPAPIR
jgi:hypothetical protein